MEKLIILRHAKAEQHQSDDFNRNLSPKGLRQVELMAEDYLNILDNSVQIYFSAALRTTQTLNYLTTIWNITWKKDPISEPSLYLASVNFLNQFIEEKLKMNKGIAIIGHNPGLSEFISYHTHLKLDHLPTFGLASFNRTHKKEKWVLENFKYPTRTI